jgi:hypothetical protein
VFGGWFSFCLFFFCLGVGGLWAWVIFFLKIFLPF